MAAPARYSGWMIIMASLGWARACPTCVMDHGAADLVSGVEVSGNVSLPTTIRDQTSPNPRRPCRRFYNQQHQFYVGGDLHERTLYLHVLDAQGKTCFEANLPANPDDDRTFLRYERGNPLGAAGPLRKPVGASPIAN